MVRPLIRRSNRSAIHQIGLLSRLSPTQRVHAPLPSNSEFLTCQPNHTLHAHHLARSLDLATPKHPNLLPLVQTASSLQLQRRLTALGHPQRSLLQMDQQLSRNETRPFTTRRPTPNSRNNPTHLLPHLLRPSLPIRFRPLIPLEHAQSFQGGRSRTDITSQRPCDLGVIAEERCQSR